ncbi:MAG: exodeoxyribonuclease VII small subunit [Chloroflexi bacterium]|nr:MAG: exodeoxyribonuclease VII small subunit [Chloroflexota bacterium]TMF02464.1 MAG: exodeoxyribonuclease VII small subunit [Chloroflexota bacterium]TMG30216.1 MAG: exodeoxyribonuclease VII small subunit [Chloroflexota bacterium]
MSAEPADVLDRLERAIARLSDPNAPLEELVSAHGLALKLLDQAEEELKDLRTRVEDLSRQLH